MSARPSAAPELFAALSKRVPPRLLKKLDANPALAESWAWADEGTQVRITTDSGETVTLTPEAGQVRSLEEARCSCLLSPQCLHLLAVISVLGVSDAPATEAAPPPAAPPTPPGVPTTLEPDQVRAAGQAWKAASDLVAAGAAGAGAVLQGDLLRAVHTSRLSGLARLSAAGVGVVNAIRDLRSASPSFELSGLTRDLGELLACAHGLTRAHVDPAWLGVARRSYAELGHLRLHGLFTEPVIAATGQSGVVTYLVDDRGEISSLGDVMPGDARRPKAAYEGGARLGALSHRQLSRAGLFVQGATRSDDGRLGAGSAVKAVTAAASSWSEAPIAQLFAQPPEAQLARVFAALDLPPLDRPAGADLLFIPAAEVVGCQADALWLRAGLAQPFRVVAPDLHTELSYRENLAILSRAPGTSLSAIVRILDGRSLTAALLAVGSAPGVSPAEGAPAPGLRWTPEMGDRCNVGLEALQSANLEAIRPDAAVVELGEPGPPDVLAPLWRRMERLVLGGRGTLPPGCVNEVLREARRLREAMLPTAAAIEEALASTALARGSSASQELARAFLSAVIFSRAATLSLERSTWLRSVQGPG